MSTVIGINFGASASSVAVISKDGLADCIANDDGERQISNAVSFSGEEEYIGIPAKSQLVRNNINTVLGFRDLLGKSYSDVLSIKPQFDSAPLVAGPNGEPAYKVTTSKGEETLTAQSIATKFVSMLIGFASDFLGRKIDAAVIGVPSNFSEAQITALRKAVEEAAKGIKVLQFLHEPASAAVAYNLTVPVEDDALTPSRTTQDRNVVVVDVGATTTTTTVLAARSGLYVPLATVREAGPGGEALDEQLIQFFSKEFTKKTKVKVDASNHRAMMKLRLSCEIVKRTLSASTSANCSIESLAEGMDFSGSINRSRFDLLAAKVYGGITENVKKALAEAKLEPLQVQEVIFIGGTCKNPTIADRVALLFPESTLISTEVDPDQAIARGCVLQARAIAALSKEDGAYLASSSSLSSEQSQTLTSPIGLMVPAPADSRNSPGVVDGKIFVTVLEANTPLPARRIVDLPFGKDSKSVLLSLHEGKEEVHVEAAAQKAPAAKGDDSDDEDEEEENTRTLVIKPTNALAELVVKTKAGAKKEENVVRLIVIVKKDGKVEIEARQPTEGAEDQKVEL